ncbi:hypothetical protein KC19_VG094800 [Ceratodon purpureus]|uniref:Uncharacterized protein n=2 Tax=Ceratodon purpureus TaxID=3225 RepID=A0A8T0HNK3_CERPU|nr:hypothetical protein KC19_VG094800 [Ceratodon purpureus]
MSIIACRVPWMLQKRRIMKHRWNIKLKRVQACSRRTNVARVPSLLPLRARGEMSFCAKFTSAVVLGAMGISGVSIYDDYLIFQQVSKKALAKANVDSEFKAIVGENIDQGPWYEASMTVDHEGHSAACSFPVSGSLCSANIHLRAVRYEGSACLALTSPYQNVNCALIFFFSSETNKATTSVRIQSIQAVPYAELLKTSSVWNASQNCSCRLGQVERRSILSWPKLC